MPAKRAVLRGASVLLALLWLALPGSDALAQAASPSPAPTVRDVTVAMGENALHYPQLEGLESTQAQQAINSAVVEKANVAQRLVTLATLKPGGTGLQVSYEVYLQGDVFSTVLSAVGVLDTLRAGQEYTACAYRLSTGEAITLADLFINPDAAVAAMEDILARTYLDELGSYAENASLSPLPVDTFSLNADGITFYYPAKQFSLVTGYAGAANFTYAELDGLLLTDPQALPATQGFLPQALSDAQIKAAVAYAASQGTLPHVPASLGDSMAGLIERYRLLREPDRYPGGRYCQLEAPAFRQVLVLTDALSGGFDHSAVNGLLTFRADLFGLRSGSTTQARWRQVLGEPDGTVAFDDSMAASYGLPVGTADYYDYAGAQLMLYADENGVLTAVRLTRN